MRTKNLIATTTAAGLLAIAGAAPAGATEVRYAIGGAAVPVGTNVRAVMISAAASFGPVLCDISSGSGTLSANPGPSAGDAAVALNSLTFTGTLGRCVVGLRYAEIDLNVPYQLTIDGSAAAATMTKPGGRIVGTGRMYTTPTGGFPLTCTISGDALTGVVSLAAGTFSISSPLDNANVGNPWCPPSSTVLVTAQYRLEAQGTSGWESVTIVP